MVVLEATLTTLSYTPDMSQISSYFVNKTLRYFVFLKQSNKLYGHNTANWCSEFMCLDCHS